MSLVGQELFTLPGHMSLPSISSRARFARSLVFCVVFYRSLFVLIWLVFALSPLIRLMDCDYPFCFFNLFTAIIDSSFVAQIEEMIVYPSRYGFL